jgi:hypothetical protein
VLIDTLDAADGYSTTEMEEDDAFSTVPRQAAEARAAPHGRRLAATSALAQTTTVHEEYYVVRDPATKKCTIVEHAKRQAAVCRFSFGSAGRSVGLGIFGVD